MISYVFQNFILTAIHPVKPLINPLNRCKCTPSSLRSVLDIIQLSVHFLFSNPLPLPCPSTPSSLTFFLYLSRPARPPAVSALCTSRRAIPPTNAQRSLVPPSAQDADGGKVQEAISYTQGA